ncbi:MAG: glycosyltransferase family 4 protein [Dermatophilaceae bacterium]
MRVGIVCPYSFDVPGGVQFHVRDLAEYLLAAGHHASVLAPADDTENLPDYLVSCGRAVPVRYNGSVARLNFGPVTAARVNRWLAEGDFDVVHIHEPVTPSAGILALWAASGPIVATFHTSNLRSRAMQAAYPVLRPSLEKITGRIAVSEDARRTVTTHLGGDAVVIPNGVRVAAFAEAERDPRWTGTPERPTVAFLGRIDEPRKGLHVLSAAFDRVLSARPGARLLIAGPGSVDQARQRMTSAVAGASEFLGMISDVDKARLFASTDLYAAPQTGGESFGIVLVEAMAAGAPVVASDLPAFVRVLQAEPGGTLAGELFPNEDADALAERLLALLGDAAERARLGAAGRSRARIFDWSVVAEDIIAVYETVTHPGAW